MPDLVEKEIALFPKLFFNSVVYYSQHMRSEMVPDALFGVPEMLGYTARPYVISKAFV